jgi:hypothetical protein
MVQTITTVAEDDNLSLEYLYIRIILLIECQLHTSHLHAKPLNSISQYLTLAANFPLYTHPDISSRYALSLACSLAVLYDVCVIVSR